MKEPWRYLLVVGLVVGLSACSGSKKEEGDEETVSEDVPAADAGTDAVPQAAPEKPAPDVAKADGLDSLPADNASPAPAPADNSAPPPAEPKASEPAPVAMSGESQQYTVKPSDTLMKIAFETYGDLYLWKKIYESNKDKITDPNRLEKGTALTLERPSSAASIERNGERYLIKMGDTLGKISDDVYGSERKWRKIYENNRQMIKDPNKIYAGFFLYYLMTDEDQKQKEEFLKAKGTPMAAAEPAPADPAAKPAQANAQGGLLDATAMNSGQAGQAGADARAPSSAQTK